MKKQPSESSETLTNTLPPELAHIHTEYLKKNLYPSISKIILRMCENLKNEEEVKRYMKHTLDQKNFDEDEKNRLEDRLMKLQLGRDRSSEEIWIQMGVTKLKIKKAKTKGKE